MLRSKFRRPWQPRMSDGQVFNPFVRSTDGEAHSGEHHDIEEFDEQAQQELADAAAAHVRRDAGGA